MGLRRVDARDGREGASVPCLRAPERRRWGSRHRARAHTSGVQLWEKSVVNHYEDDFGQPDRELDHHER